MSEPTNSKGAEVTNVVKFTGETICTIPSEKILCEALEANITDAIVIGRDADGCLYFASSNADGAEVLWLLEQAKFGLFQAANIVS